MIVEPVTATKETLNGAIEKIVFHNADSGFCVLRISAKSHPDLVTVVGHAPVLNIGEYIEAQGEWHNDRSYGLQFKSTHLKIILPDTLAGIEKYLGSGLIKGIGPHFARKLMTAFGADVLNIIEQNPEKIMTLGGIGQKRYDKIIESWTEQKSIREVMVFLQSHGVGTAKAVKIYKIYGDAAIDKVKENPYRLAQDIHGIGFKTADELAQKLGISENSLIRARAGIHFVLQEFCQQGHCGMSLSDHIQASVMLLNIPEKIIEHAIRQEMDEQQIMLEEIQHENCIFPARLYNAENSIAAHIKRLLSGKTPWGNIDPQKAIPWVENQTGLLLSDSQKLAVVKSLESKILILTGGPGVGKTTIVNSILKIISAKDLKITLCAPTGRASKRLSESTGRAAKTIHRLLELRVGNDSHLYDQQHPLDTDFVIIDEASMIDVSLMYQLLKAIPSHAGLLIVGDRDQLPSVGPGSVLNDLIHSHTIPTAILTEIFRQSNTSDIVISAHRINEGKYPVMVEENQEDQENKANKNQTDFYFIEADTPEKTHDIIIKLVTQKIPEVFKFNPLEDIQVLSPMHKGSLGVRGLNIDLQAILNKSTQKISRFGFSFAEGDKVIQMINNYDKDVFNGDIGRIQSIDLEEAVLKINFDGKIIDYDFNDLDEIALAYAITIHKSQGSEYPVVVIPLVTQHYIMLERNLLYTAVSRGKKLVVIIGQKKALSIAIKNLKNRERLTRLQYKLV